MNRKTYRATVTINGKNSKDYIMSGKSKIAVKRELISFFKKTLGEWNTVKVSLVRVEWINGDYRELK